MTKSIAEQQEFYAQFWRRNSNLNAAEIERLGEIYRAIATISLPRKARICDLGCGTGWLSQDLMKFGDVTGVDLSPDGIEVAKQRRRGPHFEVQDILIWRPAAQFDLVVSSEVLEHVPDHRAYVNTIEAILKPGGYLILTTPNLRLKKWWDQAAAGEQAIENWTSPTDLRALLANFDILRAETFLFDYLYIGPFRWLSAPKVLYLLRKLRLHHVYDAIRKTAGLGLYQIVVAKLQGSPRSGI
jgi:2-polyprenyl-3-methyl-5-hydroxy-6-metoxy-1,4-benzoquinol methylase